LTSANTLHVTNGDSAAGTMRAADLGGEVLSWRDVLHDGPVPAGLSLREMSRVRAEFLANQGFDDERSILNEFQARDDTLERYGAGDTVVLWFEWDLYDQLQLLQLLDYFAAASRKGKLPNLEIVSYAGYLGTLQAKEFPKLYESRQIVTSDMLDRGERAWEAVTSPDPSQIARILEQENTSLPFLNAALRRFLEELPWTRDGLSRSERQLLSAMKDGPAKFGEIFKRASEREERIYLGDASAADYLERLGHGESPLVAFRSIERSNKRNGNENWVLSSEMTLTETGRHVLAGKQDWISLGGSDRWLGGVHLEGGAAAWRWDADAARVRSTAGA
jgi:hypothetical protein